MTNTDAVIGRKEEKTTQRQRTKNTHKGSITHNVLDFEKIEKRNRLYKLKDFSCVRVNEAPSFLLTSKRNILRTF